MLRKYEKDADYKERWAKKKNCAKKFSLRAEHNVCADKLCAAYRKDGFSKLIKQKITTCCTSNNKLLQQSSCSVCYV